MNFKSKQTVILVAGFYGWLGGHFYLGNFKKGILYLLFFWTGIPFFLTFFDCFKLLIMEDQEFNKLYNKIY